MKGIEVEDQKEAKQEQQQAQIVRKYRRTGVLACSLFSKFYEDLDSSMIVQLVWMPAVQSANGYTTESVDCLIEYWKSEDDKQSDLQEGVLK